MTKKIKATPRILFASIVSSIIIDKNWFLNCKSKSIMHSPLHVYSSAMNADEVPSSSMSEDYDENIKPEGPFVDNSSDTHRHHQYHACEHGVDEDFLHELFQIADENEISSDDSDNHLVSMDFDDRVDQEDNDTDSNSSNEYSNQSGQFNNVYTSATSSAVSSSSSSSLPHCISPEAVPSMVTSMKLLKDDLKLPLMVPSSVSTQSDSSLRRQFQHIQQPIQLQRKKQKCMESSLQAPVSTNDGFVNAFLLVDPVRQIVFFPQQIISCQIGNKVEQMECGPFMLPTFDKDAIEQFHQNVVNPYLVDGYQTTTATSFEL